MKRKLIVALMTMAMATTTLTGCSFSFRSTPKTATDVIEKYSARETESNFNLNGEINMEIGMDAQGMSVSIPIDLELDMDLVDDAAHGDMTMSASFMGESLNESAEMYISGNKVYMYDSDSDYWTVSDSELKSSIDGIFDKDLFEDAELIVDKKAKTYTINQSFEDFMENDDVKDKLEDSADSMTGMFSMNDDDIMDAFKDATVSYVFDTDYNLLSVSLEGCSYKNEISEDGVTADVYLNFGFDFKFSKFGGIDEDDVEVPKSVKNSAIDGTDSNLGLMGSFGGEEDVNTTVPDEPLVPETSELPSTSEASSESEISSVLEVPSTQETTSSSVVISDGEDIYGSYNGVSINISANDWASTFGADGWVFDNEDGEYSFMSCKNSKYGDSDLYVYNEARSNTTKDDILNKGYYGYSIDVSWSDAKPDMTFNGLTWGASDDDIFAAYGTPDYSYTGSMYTSYEYELSDDVIMEFYIYFDKGLQEVELSIYNY